MKKKFSKKSKNYLEKSLEGVYDFMSHAYHGNWQYRWIGTPHLQKNLKAQRNESVAGHQWACVCFWFQISNICPNLNKLVDKSEIYERLLSHDLGETFIGDVSQARQVKGEGKDKSILERREIQKMSRKLPEKIRKKLLKWFDEFENDFSKMNKIEPLLSKLIDVMAGNHFAMTFGNDLAKHKVLVQKIVNRSFVSIAVQFLKVLKKRRHKKAYEEVRVLSLEHMKMMNKQGIQLDLKPFL